MMHSFTLKRLEYLHAGTKKSSGTPTNSKWFIVDVCVRKESIE